MRKLGIGYVFNNDNFADRPSGWVVHQPFGPERLVNRGLHASEPQIRHSANMSGDRSPGIGSVAIPGKGELPQYKFPQNVPTGLHSMKKGTPETAGIPPVSTMAPKAGFELARLSRLVPQMG